MSTIQYNFKSIPIIPTANNLIDIILSRTQTKTPTVTHPGYKITRIRKFYMRKVRFTYSTIQEKLEGIIKNFPKLDEIHPFYSDLINILYDKDHFKLALGTVNTAKNICEKISSDYVKLLKYGDSLYRCKQLKVAALGRMATTLKKLKSSLEYLEEVRRHLSRLPSIDPMERTLLLCGFPNVGKSSFMNKITYADSEVAEYQFTTKSLFVGHTYYKNIKWQVIDTPGLLDRSLEERNIIEMQSITALAHLDACVLYFVDISENCGHSIYEQLQLFESIKPLFKNKPLVIIANKTDIQPYNELSDEDKKLLENSAKEHNTYLIQMSNETGNGIIDVKSNACDILLKYRSVKKNGTNKDITGMDKVYVAQPVKRDNRKREPNIPESVIEERKNMIPEEISEEKFLREDNIHILEKKIKNNPIKDIIEKNGGTGIYYFPLREEFKLENPDWKYDIWPEIMDGKNVFDFIDKDILSKVEALEKEEEENMNNNDLNDDSDTSDLDDDLIEAHEKVMKNQKLIRERHELVKKNRVPKRLIGDTATEKFMDNVRPDLKEKGKEIRLLALKKGREKKEKLRKSLKKDAEIDNKDNIDIEENNLINDDMDIDEDNIKIKKRKVNNEEEKKIKIEEQKKKTLSRMQRKIQRNWSRKAIVNEADRHIGDKKPKFFNSGKRGIGKTDWR